MKTDIILRVVLGLLFTCLGCFQIFAVRRYFRQLKLHGNAENVRFCTAGFVERLCNWLDFYFRWHSCGLWVDLTNICWD
ncbi:hypothetical protein [Lactiplantibacillus plantarum]|uniref:hypothetical protein n=1 Tax=Lactiplantibacillus plantarum TaxID=1590 RepID=UPI00338F39CE